PGDYVATSGTLTFPANSTAPQTITVVVNGDSVDEVNETFTVNLGNPFRATIATGTGTATITDDDGPAISISDVSVAEGNSGTTNAIFIVTLSAPSPQTVTVNYATANGTAIAGSDYVALATNTLSFAPGETTNTITVQINGDTTDEADETFFVNLSSPSNATIADSPSQGTTVNEHTAPAAPFTTLRSSGPETISSPNLTLAPPL